MFKGIYFLFLNLFFVIDLFAMKPSNLLSYKSKYILEHFPASVFCYADNIINNDYKEANRVLNEIVGKEVAKDMFDISCRNVEPEDIYSFKSKFIDYMKTDNRFEKFYSVNQYLTANIFESFYFYCGYVHLREISGLDKKSFESFDILKHIDRKVIEKAVTKLRKSRKKVVTKQRQTKITDFSKPKRAN